MGGGLMQLVAYGAQDIYLTGNPQITFFKVVYRRHTNFAMESIRQTFDGQVGGGNRVSCTVSRNGDLVGRMYLEVTLTGGICSGAVEAFDLIDTVEVEIGGQRIDRHYGQWMHIWTALTHDVDAVAMLNSLTQAAAAETVVIPLQFWFNRNPGLALPLIALQYHEVKVIVEFKADATTAPVGNMFSFRHT